MKRKTYYRQALLAGMLMLFGISIANAYNTTNYSITVKNNSNKVVHMKLGKGVGTTSAECVNNVNSRLNDVKLDSGASYNFELSFKGGDQFYLPDGSGGSFGVPLGCLKGDKSNETTIHFDYFIESDSDAFASVLLQDYTDSGDLMRCSAMTHHLDLFVVKAGTLVIGCSANRGSDSHQAVTIYINNLPKVKEESK